MKKFETVYSPIEFRVDDLVKAIDRKDDYFQERDKVTQILMDGGINVDFGTKGRAIYEPCQLDFSSSTKAEPNDVSKFRSITVQMADTYERKNATYGNAYEDGFNRFGAVQLVSRIYEKYCRIENLLVHNADNKVPDESVSGYSD